MAFLTAGIWKKEDFFLRSSKREPMSLYQVSSDNPQEDNFHNPIFDIDKKYKKYLHDIAR